MRSVTVSADVSSSVTGRQAVGLSFVLSQIGITYGELNVITVSCGTFNSFASHILLICVVSSQSVMVPCIGGYFLYRTWGPAAGVLNLIMMLKMFISKCLYVLNMIIGTLSTCPNRSAGLGTGVRVKHRRIEVQFQTGAVIFPVSALPRPALGLRSLCCSLNTEA
jgi:hypothetical protein